MAGPTTKKRYKNGQNRRSLVGPGTSAQITKRTPINLVDAAEGPGSGQITLTFDQAVIRNGVPSYLGTFTAGVAQPTTCQTVPGHPEQLILTYPILVAGFSQLIVPFEDPGVRNGAGGYVTPETFQPEP